MHESEAGFVSDILQVLDTRLSLLEGGTLGISATVDHDYTEEDIQALIPVKIEYSCANDPDSVLICSKFA